jgi:hypothetical protein
MDKEVDQRTEDKRDQSCYQGSDVTDFHLVGCQLYRGMTIGSKLVNIKSLLFTTFHSSDQNIVVAVTNQSTNVSHARDA